MIAHLDTVPLTALTAGRRERELNLDGGAKGLQAIIDKGCQFLMVLPRYDQINHHADTDMAKVLYPLHGLMMGLLLDSAYQTTRCYMLRMQRNNGALKPFFPGTFRKRTILKRSSVCVDVPT